MTITKYDKVCRYEKPLYCSTTLTLKYIGCVNFTLLISYNVESAVKVLSSNSKESTASQVKILYYYCFKITQYTK